MLDYRSPKEHDFYKKYKGVIVLWTRELMNHFLKNHQLNKAEIGVTDESILNWINGSQDTFSSIKQKKVFNL